MNGGRRYIGNVLVRDSPPSGLIADDELAQRLHIQSVVSGYFGARRVSGRLLQKLSVRLGQSLLTDLVQYNAAERLYSLDGFFGNGEIFAAQYITFSLFPQRPGCIRRALLSVDGVFAFGVKLVRRMALISPSAALYWSRDLSAAAVPR